MVPGGTSSSNRQQETPKTDRVVRRSRPGQPRLMQRSSMHRYLRIPGVMRQKHTKVRMVLDTLSTKEQDTQQGERYKSR